MDKEKQIQKLKQANKKAMAKLGAIGGRVSFLRYGREHFANLARLSAAKRVKNNRKTKKQPQVTVKHP